MRICRHDWEGAFGTGTLLKLEVWHCRKCGKTKAWWTQNRHPGPDSRPPPRPARVLPPSYEHYDVDWRLTFSREHGVLEP